eukprot:jgi/Psemu1/59383/gm1.59383_g
MARGGQHIRLAKRVHSFLQDFQWLANDMSGQPTCIAELVPDMLVPNQVISFDNPQGTLNNSDLKLMGSIAHNNVPAHTACLTWPCSIISTLTIHRTALDLCPSAPTLLP